MYKNISLSDQIFEKLEEDILFGVYPKGEILTELKLSESLGVSRTPVREALKMLEQEHLIEDCGKGMLVLGITLEDAMNIYEIRKRIEGLAAARCAVTATDEQLQEIKEAVELQEFYAGRSDAGKSKNRIPRSMTSSTDIPAARSSMTPWSRFTARYRNSARHPSRKNRERISR